MLKAKFAKIGAVAIGMTFALSFSVNTAGAVTIAELQAQINALMAQLAALQGGATVTTGTQITSDLTVGSTGAQVVALQSALVAQGHLVMPAGVAMGYFGSLTKAAVMKWQAANGVPNTGYFGPLSRAKFNASAGATGTVPGATVGSGAGTTAGITTPGVEGTITVSLNATPSAAELHEGDSRRAVMGIKLEAKTSDIKIERVKLDLDCTTGCDGDSDFYRKIAQKVYLLDGSTVVGSADLNIDTVVEDGTDRFITISGLNYIVPKDATKVLTVALDARSTWDSDFDNDTFTVGVPVEGVRGIDGAGVNQYGPSTAFSRDFTAEGDILDDATLTISTNSGTPQDQEVICTLGSSENECEDLELLRLNLKAEKDAVTLTDLVVNITKTGAGTASTTVAYLTEGSTVIASETVTNFAGANSVTFDDIDYVISKDATKTLSVKIDVTGATAAASTFSASTTASLATAENSVGDGITESGSATGESITVRNAGLEFSLVSKSISKTSAEFSGATSSLKADFKVRITARGAAVEFGDTASTTYPFAENDGTLTAANSFIIYRGGTAVAPVVSSSTTMVIGSGVSAAGGANSWVLGEGNSVDIDLSFVMLGKTSAGADVDFGAYAIGLERLNWLTSAGRQTSTFMAGEAAWRTGTVTLP